MPNPARATKAATKKAAPKKAPVAAKPALSTEAEAALKAALEKALFCALEAKAQADVISERADSYREEAIAIAEQLGLTTFDLVLKGQKLGNLAKSSRRSINLNPEVDITATLTPHQLMKGFRPTVKLLEQFIEGAESEEKAELYRSALRTTVSSAWRLGGPSAKSAHSAGAATARMKALNESLAARMRAFDLVAGDDRADYNE